MVLDDKWIYKQGLLFSNFAKTNASLFRFSNFKQRALIPGTLENLQVLNLATTIALIECIIYECIMERCFEEEYEQHNPDLNHNNS